MESIPFRSASSGNTPNLQPQILEAPDATYLSYAPTHSGQRNYASCFERLGFNITANTQFKREILLSQLKAHVDGSVHKLLRSTDNEAAFDTMVFEFLAEHGQEYWGQSDREHLAETDVTKGFCYPRDARRRNSRLVEAVRHLFDHKAKVCVYNWEKNLNRMSIDIDYKAMTGRKADASALCIFLPRLTLETHKRRPPSHVPEDDDKNKKEDLGDDKTRTGSWNVFNTVETKTRLRPSPRHVSDDEGDRHLPIQQPKAKKRRPRMPASDFPPESVNPAKRRKEAARTAIGETPLESGSDSERPLIHKRRQAQPQPLTPPTLNAPPATPAISSHSSVIDLESHPERELPKKQDTNDNLPGSKNTVRGTSLKAETNPTKLKGEPIFAGDRAKTVLLVTASNEPNKAPITVPFTACRTSEQLFSTLINEQGLRSEAGKKVKQISATYTWNQKRHGIRRGRPEDWDRFCKAVRKAWESESDKFEDECEIEMMLHVDE